MATLVKETKSDECVGGYPAQTGPPVSKEIPWASLGQVGEQ